MKKNKTLINLAIAAGVGFVLYRFVIRPRIVKREARKAVLNYDKQNLIAPNQQNLEIIEDTEFENIT